MRRFWVVSLLMAHIVRATDLPPNYVAGSLIQLDDNGAWSWFMDERAIVHGGKLIVGSVRAIGDFRISSTPSLARARFISS